MKPGGARGVWFAIKLTELFITFKTELYIKKQGTRTT